MRLERAAHALSATTDGDSRISTIVKRASYCSLRLRDEARPQLRARESAPSDAANIWQPLQKPSEKVSGARRTAQSHRARPDGTGWTSPTPRPPPVRRRSENPPHATTPLKFCEELTAREQVRHVHIVRLRSRARSSHAAVSTWLLTPCSRSIGHRSDERPC